ncbi:MAG TPA: PLD nuclease N-terminal domain-containing protein [Marmoricola sp.]|nr:PLD nuclease N-terminal domain-containing protein [Marmoricola sp.]
MVRMELLFSLVVLGLWIFCLVDVIGSDEGAIRNLPKVAWLLIVLFFPLAGAVAWLVVGRPAASVAGRSPYERAVPHFPEYDRPGRAAATDSAADEEFLRRVRERAEAQRKAYREQRRREQDGREG